MITYNILNSCTFFPTDIQMVPGVPNVSFTNTLDAESQQSKEKIYHTYANSNPISKSKTKKKLQKK